MEFVAGFVTGLVVVGVVALLAVLRFGWRFVRSIENR